MKTRVSPSRYHAFTLIELLVVISIIAILMGLLFPAITAIIDNGNRAKAASAVKDIVNATNHYFNDYSKFPPIASAEDSSGDDTYQSFGDIPQGKCQVDNNQLFNVLRAIDIAPNLKHALNPRQQKYINGQAVKNPLNPKNGFADDPDIADATKKGGYFDPWGVQYCVVLDMDGEQEISMEKFFGDLSGVDKKIKVSVVAFSMAKDGQRGGKGYYGNLTKSPTTAPDDVVSWR